MRRVWYVTVILRGLSLSVLHNQSFKCCPIIFHYTPQVKLNWMERFNGNIIKVQHGILFRYCFPEINMRWFEVTKARDLVKVLAKADKWESLSTVTLVQCPHSIKGHSYRRSHYSKSNTKNLITVYKQVFALMTMITFGGGKVNLARLRTPSQLVHERFFVVVCFFVFWQHDKKKKSNQNFKKVSQESKP